MLPTLFASRLFRRHVLATGAALAATPRGALSLERLVSAVPVEIDEKWAADTKACIKWECQDA